MSVRIGIEIGGTKQIVVGHFEGTIVDRCRFSVNPDGGAPAIRAYIEEELPKFIAAHQPERIGMGFGGPVEIILEIVEECFSHLLKTEEGHQRMKGMIPSYDENLIDSAMDDLSEEAEKSLQLI